MRGRSAFHDLLLKTYRHQKTPMKCALACFSVDFWCFLGQLYYFFVISGACNFTTKDREELSDPSCGSEFYALSDGHIEKTFSKILQDLELR